MESDNGWPVAIDPHDCGCTECVIGQYVPSAQATDEQLVDMLTGKLQNNTGRPALVTFSIYEGEWALVDACIDHHRWLHADALPEDLRDRVRRLTPADLEG